MNSVGSMGLAGCHQVLEVSTTEAILEIQYLKSTYTRIKIKDIILLYYKQYINFYRAELMYDIIYMYLSSL